MSTSITEVEDITLGQARRKVVWIYQFINKMMLDIVPAITLNGNNQINITLTRNIESQHWTKHIDV